MTNWFHTRRRGQHERRATILDQRQARAARATVHGTGFERLEDRLAFAVTLVIPAASLLEGSETAAIVSRDGDLSAPLTVNLASSNTAAATVPTSIVIPAGMSAAGFPISGVNDTTIDDPVTVTITASAAGHGESADSIEVLNDDLRALPTDTQTDVVTLSPGAPNQYVATLGPKQPEFPGATHLIPFGGQAVFQTTGSATVQGDDFIAVDASKSYALSGWAKSGDEFGQRYDAANRQSFGFASYDVDRQQILPQHVLKFAGAADATLAAPLNPGDTTITLTTAAGWSNAAGNSAATRGLAWYGYADSHGTTYADYTYTRNVALGGEGGLWAPGAVSGNVITLSAPWSGPALPAGAAVRNTGAGEAGTFPALDSQPVSGDWTWTHYAATFGGLIPGAAFLPGAAFIKPLIVANEQGPGNFVSWRDVSIREIPPGTSVNLTPPPIDLTANPAGDQRHALSTAHPEQNLIAVSVNQHYTISSWGLVGSNSDETPLGFASFDIDQKLIHPLNVTKHAFAVDTTLAAPLLPGATSLLVTNASGWSNEPTETADTRSLAWYGYTNSLGETYADYTYTRNVAYDFDEGLWDAGAISYDAAAGAYRIELNEPWSGPALAAGAAVRNAASGQLHNQPGEAPQPQEENVWIQYTANIGGGVWQGGQRDDAAFRPGTAYIQPLFASPNWATEIVIGPQADFIYGTVQDPTGRVVETNPAQQAVLDLDVLAKGVFGGAATVVIDSVAASHGVATVLNGARPDGRAVIHYASTPSFLGTDLLEYTLRNTATGQTQQFSTRLHIVGGELQPLGTLPGFVFDPLYQTGVGQTLDADGVRTPSLLMDTPGPVNASTVRLIAGPSHGTLKLNLNGTFQYTPDPGYIGSDNFRVETLTSRGVVTVTASISVGVPNDDLILSRLKELGRGMQNYDDALKRFPVAPSTTTNYFDASGKPHLSWRVHILPYIGYKSLYSQFHLNEPWNSAHNAPLAAQMPDLFRSIGDSPDSTTTRFQTIGREGEPYLWRRSSGRLVGPKQSDFTDGLENSLLIVETGPSQAITWTKPDDLDYNPSSPLASLGNFAATGIHAVTADGRELTLPASIDAAAFHALVTISGGEVLDPGALHRQHIEQTGATPLQPYGEAAIDQNLRWIALAMQNYEDARGTFPIFGPRSYFDAAGNPYLSWRVHLLPFLGHGNLYQKFKLDEPWNSPNNLPLLAEMPDIFRSAGDPSSSTATRLATFYGANAAFRPINPELTGTAGGLRPQNFTDGLQNTIMVVEAGPEAATEWTKPGGLPFNSANPYAPLGSLPNGFRAVMFDGSVLKLPSDLDASSLAAMVTPAGGEIIDADRAAVRERQRVGQPELDYQGYVTINKFRQIVLAMLDFENAKARFPSNSFSASGQPLLSWRVHILPYLGYNALYNQFRKNEPWDSPHNLALLDQMPEVFRATDDPWDSVTTRATTFVGGDAPFPATGTTGTLGPSPPQITDGTWNTIAVIQAGRDAAAPWTKPADLPFNSSGPFSPLGDLGPHLITAMFDGSTRRLLASMTPAELQALITHQGGEDPDNPPELPPPQGTYVRQTAGDTMMNEFGADAFDVVLQARPSGPVTRTLASSDPTVATLTHSSVTFTPDNWNVPQRVGIRAVDNQAFKPDRSVGILVSGVERFTALVRDDDLPPTLAADFTGDARVDGSDFLAWQRNVGAAGALQSQGDADNDGLIGGHDLRGWKLQFGGAPGDFNQDGSISGADLAAWSAGYAISGATATGGDADGDRDVDGNDFLAWQRALGSLAEDAIQNALTANSIATAQSTLTDLSPWFYAASVEAETDALVEDALRQSATVAAPTDSVFSALGQSSLRAVNADDWVTSDDHSDGNLDSAINDESDSLEMHFLSNAAL